MYAPKVKDDKLRYEGNKAVRATMPDLSGRSLYWLIAAAIRAEHGVNRQTDGNADQADRL